ncbi:uncharacterized protein At3g28850-like [Zingiber officinale]|uniref:uncharacterized protein At3g28850-like n=1 Tax=Zingiber officinale TaxID=94328 RepID=UPI001C4A979D|nr:uncharacterized protein At3g28850-like [Zingiber officinale]
MGCTISKRNRRDRRRPPASTLARSQSLPLDRKSNAATGGEARHVVGLASSTLGQDSAVAADEVKHCAEKAAVVEGNADVSTTIAKGKLWSEKMSERIPKTPTETPPNEPEAIDAAVLMAGLEEAATARFSVTTFVDRHSFSFYPIHDSQTVLKSVQSTTIWSTGVTFQSPLLKPAASKIDDNGITAGDFDPEVLSAFRKAMEELSPQHPCLLRSPESRTLFYQDRIDPKKPNPKPGKAAEQGKVVLYFTSLRGVRKTYEDCVLVRMILKSYGVRVDERDVSMDRGFREELAVLTSEAGEKQRKESLLPAVFANGGYVGGVEEVRRMHEDGQLQGALDGCEMAAPGEGGLPCEGCGDIRFVVCEKCSGSCKVPAAEAEAEDEEEEVVESAAEEAEWEDLGGGFRRCGACNENGLVRCPVCCL